MEQSCHSSGDSSKNSSSSSSRTDHYLRQLNKSSLRISKPAVTTLKSQVQSQNPQVSSNPQPNPVQLPPSLSSGAAASQPQPVHQQPPVYNINKNDFRDVVQKLTGSPAHERLATPPPIHPPKPQSSRLQRIRPPPLANLPAPRPPAPVVAPHVVPPVYAHRPRSPAPPFSPLPPFPTVSAAAESPISSYMRYLQSSAPNPVGPGQLMLPPSSPVGLGPVFSPYPMLSPSLLFSPTAQLGFPGLPPSPRLPVPSPRWRDL